ncbi:hypothetical protein NLX83_00680 [Allokutzneria sp. A3M-2-11 16]|uniref:hypothetical protein n=1 Tax=Allokutzneria sp. A3M-2-11 16 TaxID=2962043 RepID=UPI0020B7469C|nr:hypothetical protein [Allokutzneria sp. A3M-2-11 16]MCP3797763.1 hypothetical protein [Allokutzneria sp. A3M-2-11 16]
MSNQYVRAGGWRIDLDQVPAAIKIFNDALEDINDLVPDSHVAKEIRPMGDDHVSQTLAKQVSERHLGGRGAIWALTQLQGELTKAVSTLEAAQRHYRKIEDANRSSISGK